MTVKQQKALAALISSPTRAEAAKRAGVGVTTLRRWLSEDDAFRAAYRAALAELLEDASKQSKQSLSMALDVLREIMHDGENAQTRIQAARSTLEYALKLHEAAEVEARMDELEQRISKAEEATR